MEIVTDTLAEFANIISSEQSKRHQRWKQTILRLIGDSLGRQVEAYYIYLFDINTAASIQYSS